MRVKRILAYIIDMILVSFIASIFVSLMDIENTTLYEKEGMIVVFQESWYIHLFLPILYFISDVMYGQTVGKYLMKIRVEPNLAENQWSTAVIRSVVKVVSIQLIFGVIAFFVLDRNSSLHDRAANTSVHDNREIA